MIPRSVKCVDAARCGAAVCGSGEREAGRSFGQRQVDRFEAAGGSVGQARRQGRWRSGERRRVGHGSADAAGSAGAAALVVMLPGMLPGMLIVKLILRVAQVGGVGLVHRSRCVRLVTMAGRRRRLLLMLRTVRARQHGCGSDSLERDRQQHQPHEQVAQATREGRFHPAILAWRGRNADATSAHRQHIPGAAGLATPTTG